MAFHHEVYTKVHFVPRLSSYWNSHLLQGLMGCICGLRRYSILLFFWLLWLERGKHNAWYIYWTSHQPPPNLHNLTSAWPVMLLANQCLPEGNQILAGKWARSIQPKPEKGGPPQKVDQFFRNFSGWTEPIHWVLERNFRKFRLNGSRPLSLSKWILGKRKCLSTFRWRFLIKILKFFFFLWWNTAS